MNPSPTYTWHLSKGNYIYAYTTNQVCHSLILLVLSLSSSIAENSIDRLSTMRTEERASRLFTRVFHTLHQEADISQPSSHLLFSTVHCIEERKLFLPSLLKPWGFKFGSAVSSRTTYRDFAPFRFASTHFLSLTHRYR